MLSHHQANEWGQRAPYNPRNDAQNRALQNAGRASLDDLHMKGLVSPTQQNYGNPGNPNQGHNPFNAYDRPVTGANANSPAGIPSGMDPAKAKKQFLAQELQSQVPLCRFWL